MINLNLARILAHTHPHAQANVDYQVHVVDGAQVIRRWDNNRLGPQPSELELINSSPLAELEHAKRLACRQIKDSAKTKMVSGFTSDALGSPHYYDSTIEDQLNLSQMAVLKKDTTYPCTSMGSDIKADVLHTAKEIAQVFKDGVKIRREILEKSRKDRESIAIAQTISEVDDIMTEW